MDPKASIFEAILLEFNWGQRRPIYRITNPDQFTPDPERILDTKTFKDHAALYLNWCGAMVQRDKTNGTQLFTSPAVVSRRSDWILAIFERMSTDCPNHPALIVLAKDVHQAKGTCIRYLSLFPSDFRITKTQNLFILAFIFIKNPVKI